MNRGKIWTCSRPDEERCRQTAQRFSLHPSVAAVMYNRGILSDAEIERFLRGGLEALYDPFLLKDAEKAVDRILQASARDEKVAIYGDFDVDGLTSMHVLGRFLSSLGIECVYYVPNRLVEGYGLSPEGIAECHAKGAGLLVTVDCGISSVKEIDAANRLGMDVIIVDHHEPEPVLPRCCAVIDPKRPDCSYPFSELAGVGVVYKLCRAILERLPPPTAGRGEREGDVASIGDRTGEKTAAASGGAVPGSRQLPPPGALLDRMIDMVALGTVADLAPLVDENRLLVKAGLRELEKTRNIGLQELKAVCNVAPRLRRGGVSTYDISFRIAPRLNAAGRMGNAESALRLLNSEDDVEAYNLACVMEESNKTRQKIEQKILMEAEEQILREVDLSQSRCIVVHSENWHQGVTGIVASRLTKNYYRPTIIVSVEGELGRGTARSIPEFHLLDGLRECRELLSTFGGHRLAAGFDIYMSKFRAFKERFEKITAEKLSPADITPKIAIDSVIDLSEVTPRLVCSLRMLEPFGEGNPPPVFASKGLFLRGSPTVVGSGHLRLLIEARDGPVEAIAYDMAHRLRELTDTSRPFDFAYIPRINSYKGVETLQLVIKDFQPAEAESSLALSGTTH